MRVRVDDIKCVITRRYGLELGALTSACRVRRIAWPRQVAMYFVLKLTSLSTSKTGALFGGRDHTTALHSVKAVTARAKKSDAYQNELNEIERAIFEEAAKSPEARDEERRAKWHLVLASFVQCKTSCGAVRAYVPRKALRFYPRPPMPIEASTLTPAERSRLMSGRA